LGLSSSILSSCRMAAAATSDWAKQDERRMLHAVRTSAGTQGYCPLLRCLLPLTARPALHGC
jgi:hypothetical protein